MIKSRKKRRNRYQESRFGRLKGNIYALHGSFFFFALFFFVVLFGAGLSRFYQRLIEAPWFKLKEIEITGINKLDRPGVLDTMGIRRGQCTLSIDTAEVHGRLEKLLMVRESSVRLESGGRLAVEMTEREPVAIVRCGDRDLQMDFEGILFSEASPNEKRPRPLITGLCGAGLKTGDRVEARSLEYIKELLAAVDRSRSWLSGTAISECRWSETGFTLVLGERAVPVDIGRDGFEQKLAKLRKVIDSLNERGWTDLVTRIDLDYPGQAYLEGRFSVPRPVQGPARQPG